MALNQTNKLVWIVETINRAGKITFEDLNRKWMDNVDLSGGEEMLKRTFHKWRDNIFDTFGLLIECEKGGLYRYYISNTSDLHNDSIENWLLSTYSVTNSLIGSKSIKNRIILEDIPSGMKYLDSIIDAMKKDCLIHITYYNYWRGGSRQHYVMPLCVKLFRQRWYMVGKAWSTGFITIFCLDRIKNFRLSSHTFEYPVDFSPEEYFNGCFGIITDENYPIQRVLLKVDARQAHYLRDLPLLPSGAQKELEHTNFYSIFELQVRPSIDFQQELLCQGDSLEVLEPQWLRDEIARIGKGIWEKNK